VIVGVARGGTSITQIVAFVLLAAALSSSGNLVIKNALKSMGGLNLGANAAQSLLHLFTNPGVVVGLVLYLIGFVLWARALSIADISTAYPIFISLAFTIVVVGSRIFFNESLGLIKIAGIVIIAVGIVVVSRG
jgi:multidrug transporter EmrE-like cation transporter